MLKQRDYQGLVALILSVGLVLSVLSLLTGFGGNETSNLDTTLLATVFGGLIANIGQFLTGTRRSKTNGNDDGSTEQE